MVFSYFSAYGFTESETTEKIFQFRDGFFEPTETSVVIPREILARSFPFVFLQHLAILDVVKQSQLQSTTLNKTGIICGSATGGIQQLSQQYKKFNEKGLHKMSALTVPLTIHNSASSVLAIEHKIKGISSGYHCMETSGVEALCDSIALMKENEFENMFIGVGEDLSGENMPMQQIGGALYLSSFNSKKTTFCFEINNIINRGKPWLSAEENFLDIINSYNEIKKNSPNNQDIKEKWLYFNFQNAEHSMIINDSIELVEYPQFMAYLSMAPFLGLSMGMQLYDNFKLLTISSEGHGVLIEIKKL